MKLCTQCNNCLLVDEGYSNYTVEGTTVYCILNANPYSPFDRWYNEEPKLKVATNCEYFDEGQCGELDVERERLPGLHPKYTDYLEKEGIKQK